MFYALFDRRMGFEICAKKFAVWRNKTEKLKADSSTLADFLCTDLKDHPTVKKCIAHDDTIYN